LPRDFKDKIANRIIDANINRAKEGLRVCEEIARFILNNKTLTSEFKNIRHKINACFRNLPAYNKLIGERQSKQDVGRKIYAGELKRNNLGDIFTANIQRVKESVRVLEEFSKLNSTKTAIRLKNIRYKIYDIEKKATGKIQALLHYR